MGKADTTLKDRDGDPEDLSGDEPSNNHDVVSNRLQVFRYLENNPGAHLRKISKELGLAMGDTQYHLGILEKSGKIRSRKINLYRRYYPASILRRKGRIDSSIFEARNSKRHSNFLDWTPSVNSE